MSKILYLEDGGEIEVDAGAPQSYVCLIVPSGDDEVHLHLSHGETRELIHMLVDVIGADKPSEP